MMRPTLEELAKERAKLQQFLAANPNHELAPALRVMLRATAPFTQAEAIPVLIEHANQVGEWAPDPHEEELASKAIVHKLRGTWEGHIRAQWAVLTRFFGGAP